MFSIIYYSTLILIRLRYYHLLSYHSVVRLYRDSSNWLKLVYVINWNLDGDSTWLITKWITFIRLITTAYNHKPGPCENKMSLVQSIRSPKELLNNILSFHKFQIRRSSIRMVIYMCHKSWEHKSQDVRTLNYFSTCRFRIRRT